MKRMKLAAFAAVALVLGFALLRITERSIQSERAPSPSMLWADDLVTAKLKKEGFTQIKPIAWKVEGQTGFEAIAKDGRKVRGYVTSNPEPLGERVHVVQWGIE